MARTGDIALFKIISEQGVAAGVRRIEALTGEADPSLPSGAGGGRQKPGRSIQGAGLGGHHPGGSPEAQRRKLERELADAKRQLAVGRSGPEAVIEEVNGVKFIGRVLQGVGGKDLRSIAETFRKQIPDGVVALNGVLDGKVANTVVVSGSAQARFNAVDLARAAVRAMGGQGAGGKPDFAQGGAPDGSRADEGLAAVRAALAG